MMSTTTFLPQPTLTLDLDPVMELDDEKLFLLCRHNRDLRIERSSQGELEIMSAAGGKTAAHNAEIIAQLLLWARSDRRGQVFDSSGGFLLPSGAMRSPDAAWVEKSRLQALSAEEKERFLPLCPTFVVELRSPSDTLAPLQAKMDEFRSAGARLGWLIDPLEGNVHVYREGEIALLENPAELSGEPEMPGLVLEMKEIWEPNW